MTGEVPPWDEGMGRAGMRFLAALATDSPDVVESFDAFFGDDDPDRFVVGLVTLLNMSGALLTSASGVSGLWSFQLDTPLGQVPIEQSVSWAARFAVAAMNGDHATAFSLWHVACSESDAEAQSKHLSGIAIPLMRHAVREFIASGRKFDEAAMRPWAATS